MKKVISTKVVGGAAGGGQAVDGLGVDQVDPIVGFVARTISDVTTIDKDADGRIENHEILQLGWSRSQDAFGTFRNWGWKEFVEQLRDLDSEERQAQVQLFAKEFDLRNDEVEFLFEDWMRWLDLGASLVGRTRKLLKK